MTTLQITTGVLYDFALIIKRHSEAFLHPDPPTEWLHGEKGDIVVVPGWAETWIFSRFLGNKLHQLGYRIHIVRAIDRVFEPIESATNDLAEYLLEHDLKNVIHLTHSKGGLVARNLLRTPAGNRVRTVFTLATAHHGTVCGYFPVKGVKQLRPRSETITRLNADTSYRHKIINIFPTVDNHVHTIDCLKLDGATNIQLDTIGHTAIQEDQQTFDVIKKYLTK